MRGRRKEKAASRATELKEQARAVAGQSGEAIKELADATGVAAKEFAIKTKDAAKEFVDTIEKAAKSVDEDERKPRRGRRLLKLTLAIGTGIAVFSNERARSAISSLIGRSSTGGDQPEVWRPETSSSSTGNGEAARTATTSETT